MVYVEVDMNRSGYRVRCDRVMKPLQKAVCAIRGNHLFRSAQARDEWIEQELGLKISHQANGVVKVEFPSKDEYLLFVLKWA